MPSLPSLMPFTLTDEFCGLEMSLSNILMTGLFRLNNRMAIFSKTEKKLYHNKHVRDHAFMMPIWKGWGGGGSVKICHMSCFSTKDLLCSFLRMERMGRGGG